MRQLSAILFMDVVGYSKRMSLDESGTLAKIKSFTEDILNPAISKHKLPVRGIQILAQEDMLSDHPVPGFITSCRALGALQIFEGNELTALC